MVLYRKYRPQKLSELDNEEISKRLIRVFSSAFIPHALLFAGPKGTGKTSAARIVAKVLNCERKVLKEKDVILGTSEARTPESQSDSGRATIKSELAKMTKSVEPCNVCETCVAITEGRHLDIIEIDAASNRGIDEIRDLREKIKLAPVSARFKVYIIDEVHMLTNEAFNALLKTLEEPPPHAVFILATTEPEKLPQTIVSRCIRFNFQRAKISEVVHCLKRVVRGEKLKIADDILEMIAASADGSFRDATKILEQAILENALTLTTLSFLLGRENVSAEKFLRILVKGDVTEALKEVKKLAESGASIRFLVEDILTLLHNILLAQYGIESEKVASDLPKLIDKKETPLLIRLFSRVFVEIKNTNIPYLPLEIAVVEWCEKKGGAHV